MTPRTQKEIVEETLSIVREIRNQFPVSASYFEDAPYVSQRKRPWAVTGVQKGLTA